MTLMILCTYLTAWGMPVGIATVIWVLAVIIHFGLMIFSFHGICSRNKKRMANDLSELVCHLCRYRRHSRDQWKIRASTWAAPFSGLHL